MAAFEVDFGVQPELFENFNFEPIAVKALTEAATVQVQATQAALQKVIHGGSGKLANSVKPTTPKKASNGAYIVHVRPTGTDNSRSDNGKPRSKPVRNMAKAAYLEYGVAGRQPARPWAQSATNAAQGQINEILERVVTEGVEKALGS